MNSDILIGYAVLFVLFLLGVLSIIDIMKLPSKVAIPIKKKKKLKWDVREKMY